ncbi:MAG: hypothetical protein M3305_10340 [Actinomycetota bacterium]|nr:hypothetical protein [Actinomycetota bacterium]
MSDVLGDARLRPYKLAPNWEIVTNDKRQRCRTSHADVWVDDYSNLLSAFDWH